MHHPIPSLPSAGDAAGHTALPTSPHAPAAAAHAEEQPRSRSFDGLGADLAGLASDAGAVEYASWLRLLRPRGA